MNDGIIASIAFLGRLVMTDCFDLLTSLGHGVGLVPASSLALMAVGFLAGVAAGLLGIGGGLMILAMMSGLQLMWPQMISGGLSFAQLTGFAALQSFTASVSATTVHAIGKRICYKTSLLLGGVALLGGYIGGRWSVLWNETALRLLMAAMLIILMVFYWVKTAKNTSSAVTTVDPSSPSDLKSVSLLSWTVCFAVAFVTGVAAGLLGIGGSVFLIPLMVGLLWVPLSHSSGSGSATAVLIAGASVVGKAQAGLIDWPHALLMAGAGLVGGAVGAQWMPHIPPKMMRILFLIMMISATLNALSGLF